LQPRPPLRGGNVLDSAETLRTGLQTPSSTETLRTGLQTPSSTEKRYGRGCKPRPAQRTGLSDYELDLRGIGLPAGLRSAGRGLQPRP
jgi:hypothetical protein